MNDLPLKTIHYLAYISAAESIGVGLCSTTFTECAPKVTEFEEITQLRGYYAVQGHSRSPSLIPVESSYATSY